MYLKKKCRLNFVANELNLNILKFISQISKIYIELTF